MRNKPQPLGPPQPFKYGGGGIGGGINSTDPYNVNYQENSQGAQGSIGSSGSGMQGGQKMGSRGGND